MTIYPLSNSVLYWTVLLKKDSQHKHDKTMEMSPVPGKALNQHTHNFFSEMRFQDHCNSVFITVMAASVP